MPAPVPDLPPPRCPRYDTLDAWRGLACLLVVLFHATYQLNHELPAASPDAPVEAAVGRLLRPFAAFWVGVPVFFVISGYCIAAAADSARRRPHPAGRFFLRRFRRIYPPLWVFLAGTVVLHLLLAGLGNLTGLPLALSPKHPADVSAWSWVGSATLTEEWRWHLVGPPRDYFQWAVWTLCYEEQFYLLLGLAVLLAPRRLFAVAGAISLGVFLIVCDVIRLPFSTDGWFFGGPWLAFAAGIGVYYRRNYASPVLRRVIDVGLLAGAVWACRGVAGWEPLEQSVPAQLTAAFAAAFVIGLLEPLDGFTAKWKLLAPLRWCGVRCYSLYLVHGPVVYCLSRLLVHLGCVSPTATLAVTVPVCVGGALAAGWAFHRWVEAKFLNPPAADSDSGRGGTRTRTPFRGGDFKSPADTPPTPTNSRLNAESGDPACTATCTTHDHLTPELLRIAEVWHRLPPPIRATVVALVNASTPDATPPVPEPAGGSPTQG